MVNPQALETFGKYDKKSLMAGVVVGQGLKGRARAPQTPAPAGFPQGLWDDAVQRANNMIASMQGAGQSGGTPETPDDWQFDKDAFCFGIAAGRSLEGWEIDGGTNLYGYTKIMYYIYLERPDTVTVNFYVEGTAFIDWGDETPPEISAGNISSGYMLRYSHAYQSGGYVVTLISNRAIAPTGSYGVAVFNHTIAGKNDYTYYNAHAILHRIYLSGNVPYIGKFSFYNSKNLSHVSIPDSVARIDLCAFEKCSGLTSVTIPVSVTTISDDVFTGCTALTDVYYGGTETQWDEIKISRYNDALRNATIHYNSTGADDVHDD